MRTALVLGSAACLHDDLARARASVRFDGVVACNAAGIEWPGRLDAWASLHGRYFRIGPAWRAARAARGYPEAARHYAHPEAFRGSLAQMGGMTPDVIPTRYDFAGEKSGSSGLFAAKVALVDLGFDRVVLCGIPMDPAPHFNGPTNWTPKAGRSPCDGFRRSWLAVPEEYRARMRSMSGWSRVLLGAPEETKERNHA
ncbi:MAG: hypothetical protein ACU0CF_04685 [Sagittula sp.]|uniref:hypothetical protein n=1 Tax=Sagittula sp. TaxID=2038081 RepID=UPI00405951DC